MVIYTTVFGNTDPLHEQVMCEGGRFVCFTDQPLVSETWEIVKIPRSDTPTRLARTFKMMPHRLFPGETTLWIDSCFTLKVHPSLLEGWERPFTTFSHSDRRRIADEARQIANIGKAPADKVMAQLRAYQAEGFDTDQTPLKDLSCTGCTLRRDTAETRAINELWLDQLKHTLRDQMSLDYCAWKLGFTLGRWPGSHDNNPYFAYTFYKRPVNDT